MIRALPATAALVALAAALAGCSSDTKPAAAPPSSPPPPTASSSPTGSPTASPSPSVNPDTPLPLGKSTRTADGYVTATVYGYRHNVAKSAPRPDEQPGYVWGAADVKVCANKDISASSVGVSHGPWVLVFADDTVAEPSSTGYESFPEPAYPWAEKALAPGRCVRGWITFPVPGKKRPAFVEYAPEGEEVTPRWAVK
ncbi:hypothetical protein OOK41_31570 [Micromonospora sp. NBC_01655]|uniref:hypothetical protein n=1 Tax=Micromonospora sp. NBC_01655 TaxID=2975983 RepID=UPI00224FB8D1|nr:hypothetical protein [Micromonospora sp. NBC_01655]MCX4474801.1 hypothetical protein [Micromonospora sp. NBC_01655]